VRRSKVEVSNYSATDKRDNDENRTSRVDHWCVPTRHRGETGDD
jgi:hypothetical protein